MADIEFEIDGQTLKAKPGQTIIEVADKAGIYIPRFCYHKHLSVAANCRMCLVEVEKAPKTLPACATPVMDGMKVQTRSRKAIESQKVVMEFLLINHPLDCPICDQGGECELQDLSMGYGAGDSQYEQSKRAVTNENLGPLIATGMTRCILCTRCVRFGKEVAGLPELGVVQRGEHAEIKTFVEQAVTSEVSGNMIDICPVGALTSKPYRFKARSWEMQQAPGVSPHDCLGTNIYIQTYQSKVLRVVAKENQQINQTWITDRDRFAYEGLYHSNRLASPRIKQNGKWMNASWREALEFATSGLQKTLSRHGADSLGSLASPSSTLEEFYLLQKLSREIGSSNIDHRLREVDTRDQADMGAFPMMEVSLPELAKADAILLIGSHLRKEQPLAALRVREAVKNGAEVAVINSVDYDFNFKVKARKIVAPHRMPLALAALVEGLHAGSFKGMHVNDEIKSIMDVLQNKQNIVIVLGSQARGHIDASFLRYLAQRLAKLTTARLCLMTDGANSAGAWLAGAVPHRKPAGVAEEKPGLSAHEMLTDRRKAYILLNVEPELDCADAAQTVAALAQAEFVVALSLYGNATLDAKADVILPIAAFGETAGTYVSAHGEWQRFNGVANAFEEARPAWKVLRVMGNFLNLNGFDYESSDDVFQEIKQLIDGMPELVMHLKQPVQFDLIEDDQILSRIGEIPIYAVDALTRHSQPLQEAQLAMEGDVMIARIHPETARKHHIESASKISVRQQKQQVVLSLKLDERVAKEAIWVAGGISKTAALGNLFGGVEVSSC